MQNVQDFKERTNIWYRRKFGTASSASIFKKHNFLPAVQNFLIFEKIAIKIIELAIKIIEFYII
jgi:hypothetical protein